jgi:hypothetical protein
MWIVVFAIGSRSTDSSIAVLSSAGFLAFGVASGCLRCGAQQS